MRRMIATIIIGSLLIVTCKHKKDADTDSSHLSQLEYLQELPSLSGCSCYLSDSISKVEDDHFLVAISDSSATIFYNGVYTVLHDASPLTPIGSDHIRRDFINGPLKLTIDLANQAGKNGQSWYYKGSLRFTDKSKPLVLTSLVMGNCSC